MGRGKVVRLGVLFLEGRLKCLSVNMLAPARVLTPLQTAPPEGWIMGRWQSVMPPFVAQHPGIDRCNNWGSDFSPRSESRIISEK